jgi:hypothetical protein
LDRAIRRPPKVAPIEEKETMARDRESIIRKLKLLYAKSKSSDSLGLEAEAQTFALGIQKMLTEYKIERSEIEQEDSDDGGGADREGQAQLPRRRHQAEED